MTAQQLTDQLITEARTQLDTAQVARLVSTGGADLGLMAALEFWGDDLVRAGETRDPQTWGRALTALRTLTARQ
jgi:hypothetical protein